MAGVYHFPKESENRWYDVRFACASSTERMIRESIVSDAGFVTRTSSDPFWLIVPAKTSSPGAAVHGNRFSRDRCLVDIRRPPRDDRAVDRHPLARSDDHDFADADRLDRTDGLAAVAPDQRFLRHERHERPDRTPGFIHGVGLEDVAKGVNDDQDRGLSPPEAERHRADRADQHEQVDRRRQVLERDQGLSCRIVDADEHGEQVEPVHDGERRPEVSRDEGDHCGEEAPVEGELLWLTPPGALPPPLAPHLRGGHPPRLSDGADDLLDPDDRGIVADPGLTGDRRDLVAPPDAGEGIQFSGEQVGVAGAVHPPLNLQGNRIGLRCWWRSAHFAPISRRANPPEQEIASLNAITLSFVMVTPPATGNGYFNTLNVEDLQDLNRLIRSDPVPDVYAVPPRLQDPPGLLQDPEVLRDCRLCLSNGRHEGTRASLAIHQALDDLYSCLIGESFQQFYLPLHTRILVYSNI